MRQQGRDRYNEDVQENRDIPEEPCLLFKHSPGFPFPFDSWHDPGGEHLIESR
jgi:hypothetical protein